MKSLSALKRSINPKIFYTILLPFFYRANHQKIRKYWTIDQIYCLIIDLQYAVLQRALFLTIVLQVWPLKGSWVFQSQYVNLKRHDPISVDIKPQRFMKVTRLKTYYMILSPWILKLIGSWSFQLGYLKWLVHDPLLLNIKSDWFMPLQCLD